MVSVEKLSKQAASMEKELNNLLKSVDKQRRNFHALNYFTTKQLLLIRHDFGKLKQDQTIVVTPQVFSLLRSFSWQITLDKIINTISTVSALPSEQETNHDKEKEDDAIVR